MTNAPNNRRFNGNRCPICGVKIRGYLQWLCPKHRTKEFAAQANREREAAKTKCLTPQS